MSSNKKRIRQAFRDAVFARDGHKCRACGAGYVDDKGLDAHHITDRTLMPNGGYVVENGISLCPECHVKAEKLHQTGEAYPDYRPSDLYQMIGSSYEQAVEAAERLK
jgi:5-methylcytosine-specific restriction endonuclease McrA